MKKVNNYQLIKPIGKGGFGQVFLAKKDNSPELFAIKVIPLENIQQRIKDLKTEVDVMKELDHENIIKGFELLQTSHNFYMILEFCNGGDLSALLKDYKKKFNRPFSIPIIQYFMRQIVKGIACIHSKKIIHRDLKLENIMITFQNPSDKENFQYLNGQIKIIDFGVSARLDNNGLAQTCVGTLPNMDPLLLAKYNKAGGLDKLQGYNEKTDIWALGTIFYEMLTGETLFPDAKNSISLMEKVEQGDYKIPLNYDLSNEVLSFLNAMLQYNPDKRYSAVQLLQHDFIVKNVQNFTPICLDKISYKVQEGELVINCKDNVTIWKIFNQKEKNDYEGKRLINNFLDINRMEEEQTLKDSQLKDNYLQFNNKIQQYVVGLYNEYSAAAIYFKKTNKFAQYETTSELFKEISNFKSAVESGKTININALPKPITPEYIYGCSKAERDKKFVNLINYYKNEKMKLEEKINDYNMNNASFLHQDIVNIQQKLQTIDGLLEKLDVQFRNEWVPGPDFTSEKISSPTKKKTKQLQIIAEIHGQKKADLALEMNLKINDNKNLTQLINLNQNNNYSEKFSWKINSNDELDAKRDKENFLLSIENKKTHSTVSVHLAQTISGKDKAFNVKYPCRNKEEIILYVIAKLIKTQLNPTYTVLNQESLVIKTLYPAFMGKSKFTEEMPQF